MKSLGVKVAKQVQDLSAEKYKMLMKEIKEGLCNWRDISHSWIGRLNVV